MRYPELRLSTKNTSARAAAAVIKLSLGLPWDDLRSPEIVMEAPEESPSLWPMLLCRLVSLTAATSWPMLCTPAKPMGSFTDSRWCTIQSFLAAERYTEHKEAWECVPIWTLHQRYQLRELGIPDTPEGRNNEQKKLSARLPICVLTTITVVQDSQILPWQRWQAVPIGRYRCTAAPTLELLGRFNPAPHTEGGCVCSNLHPSLSGGMDANLQFYRACILIKKKCHAVSAAAEL